MPIEGRAVSVGIIGTSKIISIEGSAISTAGVRSALAVVARTTDEIPSYNKTMFVDSLTSNQTIVCKVAETFVSSPKRYKSVYVNPKTVTVSTTYMDQALRSKTVQSIDMLDTSKKILGLLTLYPCDIKDPGANAIDIFQKSIKIIDNKYKRSIPVSNRPLIYPHHKKSATVIVGDKPSGKTVLTQAYTFVEQRIVKPGKNGPIYKPASTIVDDYRPPTGGTSSGSGGLKMVRISAQMYSYFEHALFFNEGNVKNVTGLPQGIFYELGYIKGSPTLSGNYPITIKLDNNISIPGTFIVPQLQRQF